MTTEREYLESYIYDEYKSVHGIRPRWMDFAAMSLEELRALAREVESDLIRHLDEEAKREAEALAELEAEIDQLVKDHRIDRATAMRWILDSYDETDVDRFCWERGIAYKEAPKIRELAA